MVVTKENVAAHAIAEHLVALQLPQDVQQLIGRLVGYYEQRRKGSGTPLDLPVENRNNHIRQKSLLMGCGGGFLQECGQPHSPVSDWIKQVDLVLEDEGQQYGNMEEAATIARTPRACFEIWSGDHRQTPGGLQQTEEAKKFRRKLLKRPLALRCPTDYIQPHGLAAIAARYLEGHLTPVRLPLLVSCEKRSIHILPSWIKFGQNWLDREKSKSAAKCRRLLW